MKQVVGQAGGTEFRGRDQEGLSQAWSPWFSHRTQRHPHTHSRPLLGLLASSQRHSWDVSGGAEGTYLFPCSRPWSRQPFSLPNASSNTVNSGATGSPSRAGNFPSAGNVQLGVAGNVQLGRRRGGPASVLTLGRLQQSSPRPWLRAWQPLK